jgi:hypothetical protein
MCNIFLLFACARAYRSGLLEEADYDTHFDVLFSEHPVSAAYRG